MSDERPSEVLGGLSRTRPHRRSQKRAAPAVAGADLVPTTADGARTAPTPRPPLAAAPGPTKPAQRVPAAAPGATKRATRSPSRVRQPAQPPGTPPVPSVRRPTPAGGVDLIGSAVHVTAELAEIGISAGARALRGVVARLPRP